MSVARRESKLIRFVNSVDDCLISPLTGSHINSPSYGEAILLFIITFFVVAVFQDNMLKRHNKLRARHGSPPLTIDASLASEAGSYARTMAGKMQYDSPQTDPNLPKGQGENVYSTCSEQPTGDSVTNVW